MNDSLTTKSTAAEPDMTEVVPAAGGVDHVDLAAQVSLPLAAVAEATALALAPAFARRSEQMREATERLHPVLRKALADPLAASFLDRPIVVEEQFTQQPELLQRIDELNDRVGDFMKSIEDPKALLGFNAGKDLVFSLGYNAALFKRGGMLRKILIAFEILAKTRLRDLTKKESRFPFDEEEFVREQMIHKIMGDLIAGLTNDNKEGYQGGNVG